MVHGFYNIEEFTSQTGNKRKLHQGGKFLVNRNSLIKFPIEGIFLNSTMRKMVIDGSSKKQILADLINESRIDYQYLLPEISIDTKEIIEQIIITSKNNLGLI